MLINAAGRQTNIAQFYEGTFKAGFNYNDMTVNQAWPLGADTAMSMGEYRITGKNQTGAPMRLRDFGPQLMFVKAVVGKSGC
jgi:hypothetical protein